MVRRQGESFRSCCSPEAFNVVRDVFLLLSLEYALSCCCFVYSGCLGLDGVKFALVMVVFCT
jgi:hypothetical protein